METETCPGHDIKRRLVLTLKDHWWKYYSILRIIMV